MSEFVARRSRSLLADLLAWLRRTRSECKHDAIPRKPTLFVAVSVLTFILAVAILSLRRYAALHTHSDLALYSQVVWNTARGDFFRNSVLPFAENYLGNHFTPILAAFVPLYALWEDPRVLLLVQLVANALGAWPLYWLAREKLNVAWAGAFIAGGYLLYPALHHQTLNDFHGIALATPVVLLAFYALLTERNRLLFATLPVMVLIREDLPLVIIMMGVYATLVQRRRRLGVFLFGLGLVVSYLVIQLLIPAFRGGGDFFYSEYYDYLGSSPVEIVRTVVTQPEVALRRLFFVPKYVLLLQLLASVAFLPLLAPSVIVLGGSALAYLMLVDFPFNQIYRLNAQYQALFIPVVFVGTVLGLARLADWAGRRWSRRRVALAGSGLVLGLSAITLVLWGPLADPALRDDYRPTERSRAEWEFLEQIPEDAGVVAAGRLTAPLSTREGFYRFGGLFRYDYPLDYLLSLDTPVGYVAHPPVRLEPVPADGRWLVPRYEQVGAVETTRLWRRSGAVSTEPLPAPAIFDEIVALIGAGTVGGSRAMPGEHVEIATVWESRDTHIPRLVFSVQMVERRNGATHRWTSTDRELYDGLFPSDKWEQGAVVGDVFRLSIPRWMPPGEYELLVGAYTREGSQQLRLSDGASSARIGTVTVVPPAPLPNRTTVDIPNETDDSLAQGVKLRGYTPILEQYDAGTAVDFTIFWRATEPMDAVYNAHFRLVPEGAETPVAEWTQPLGAGRFPNTEWQPETVVGEWIHLPLASDLTAGTYRLSVAITGSEDPDPPVHLTSLAVVGAP